jgi:hypothetical protein
MRNANATKDSLDHFKEDNASLQAENDSLRSTVAYQDTAIHAASEVIGGMNALVALGQAQHNADKKTIKKLNTSILTWKGVAIVEGVALFVTLWKQAF